MTTSIYNKCHIIPYNAGLGDTITAITRTYTDLVVDTSNTFYPSSILVAYNGQALSTDTTSKYYYSITPTYVSSVLTGFSVSIHANTHYVWPGYVLTGHGYPGPITLYGGSNNTAKVPTVSFSYTGPTYMPCQFSTDDIFSVSYCLSIVS